MVDRAESLKSKVYDVKFYGYAVYEVTVSLNDTITLADFVTTENLKKAVLNRQDTGAEVTVTHVANNVVTVTGVATDLECILYAFGRRA